IDQQSAEADQERRKKLVWEIEHRLAEEGPGRSSSTTAARPAGNPCEGPYHHGKQHLKRRANGGRLAGPVDLVAAPRVSLLFLEIYPRPKGQSRSRCERHEVRKWSAKMQSLGLST